MAVPPKKSVTTRKPVEKTKRTTKKSTVAAETADGMIVAGKALGLELIAEGVETKEQLIFLTTLNCLQIQGYYFSRPLTVQAMTKLLTI